MATDQVAIYRPQTQSAPADYVLSTTQDIQLETVVASFDGTGSSGAFLPALQIVLPSGVVAGTYVDQNTPVTQGGSAAVTFGPFLRGVTSGTPSSAITSVTSSDGSVSVTNGTGPVVDLSIETATWNQVILQADQSYVSTTVQVAVPGITFNTTAGKSYAFELYVAYANPTGNTAGGLKTSIGEDSTARGWVSVWGWTSGGTILSSAFLYALTTTVSTANITADRTVVFKGTHTGNGSPWIMKCAQNVSDPTAVVLRAGTVLRWFQVTH